MFYGKSKSISQSAPRCANRMGGDCRINVLPRHLLRVESGRVGDFPSPFGILASSFGGTMHPEVTVLLSSRARP